MTVPARAPRFLPAIVLLSLSLAGCDIAVDGSGGFDFGMAAGKAADQWTRSYPLGAGDRLEIINVNGRITAEASDGDAVEILAERTVKAVSDERAKELLQQIEMREEVGDGRVRVEVRAPRFSGGGHEITWTIKVPRRVSVDLRTINGGVRINGLSGEVRARSTNGGITGRGLAATGVDAGVTNGGVDIELTEPITSGDVALEAVNGGIKLSLPPDSRADITGRCVNGGVTVTDLALEIAGEQSRRRIDATLNGGGARVSLQTVNGGVRISGSSAATEES